MSKQNTTQPNLYAPRRWPVHIILGFLSLWGKLPYAWQLCLGRLLGRLLFKLGGSMLRVSRTNIDLCFPELSAAEKQVLLKKNFESVGIGVFELISAGYGRKRMLKKLLRSVEGFDEVEKLMAEGESVVLLFPHLIPIYLAGRLMVHQTDIPFGLMYHTPKEPVLNHKMHSRLSIWADKIFTRKNFREMIRYLKNNKLVWYAPDLDMGAKLSEFAPFFGVPAATTVSTLRIASMTNAKLVPIAFYRRDDNKGYDIKAYPALNDRLTGDDAADTRLINATFEDIIRAKPEQYLWQYKRFNTRPRGEEKLYKKKADCS